MSQLWPKFTKQNPCPACGHGSEWCCRAGDKKFICMRIESPHPSRDGGWYHEYGGEKPKLPARKFSFPKREIDFESSVKIARGWDDLELKISILSKELGVSTQSLNSLEAGWSGQFTGNWTFPMRDGEGNIIGIHLRHEDGSKKAITGSRNGLFLPDTEPEQVVYLPEGASNTAALLTMGFYSIGRPSCNSGGDMLKVALKRLGVRRIVIVADNDTEKTAPNGRKFRPGQAGALKLQKELGMMSVIFTPPNPVKDVRQLLQKLGVESARNFIASSVSGKVWWKP